MLGCDNYINNCSDYRIPLKINRSYKIYTESPNLVALFFIFYLHVILV